MADVASPSPARAEPQALARLALDLGPILVFFAANQLVRGEPLYRVLVATACFMVATVVAMAVALAKFGRVSAMLMLSTAMVLVFGGLTLWLQNETFIKVKPTVYYAIVSSLLGFGLWTGRPTLQLVLGAAYPGLNGRGWTLLTRNWAIFFVVLGIANEIVWRNSTTAFWLGYKLWGSMPATVIFALANVPMLIKHGLNDKAAAEPETPPQG